MLPFSSVPTASETLQEGEHGSLSLLRNDAGKRAFELGGRDFSGLVTGGAETGSSGTLDDNFALAVDFLGQPLDVDLLLKVMERAMSDR